MVLVGALATALARVLPADGHLRSLAQRPARTRRDSGSVLPRERYVRLVVRRATRVGTLASHRSPSELPSGSGLGLAGERARHRPGGARSGDADRRPRSTRPSSCSAWRSWHRSRLDANLGAFAILALPLAFVGYVFPTEYLGWRARRRQARLRRELPDFLALVRPLAEQTRPRTRGGRRGRRAPCRHRQGETCWRARSVRPSPHTAPASTSMRPSGTSRPRRTSKNSTSWRRPWAKRRHVGKGIGEILAEHERSMREGERNRLLGAASTVQPKLALILAGVYLPSSWCSSCCPCSSRRWGGSRRRWTTWTRRSTDSSGESGA